MDPTIKLPVETISYIFHSVQTASSIPTIAVFDEVPEYKLWRRGQDVESSTRDRITRFKLAWIAITHVCSRWRTIALNDPSLWADVPCVLGIQWMDEFIARSAAHSISFNWKDILSMRNGAGMSSAEFKTDVAKRHYRRLRNLEAVIGQRDELFSLLSLKWPKLEELNVFIITTEPVETLLANDAPRLRSLRYCLARDSEDSSLAFSWTAPFLDNLVVLELGFRDGMKASADKLLDLLERMHCLEHLNLSGHPPFQLPSSAQCSSCHPGTPRTVPIPLKTLSLGGNHAMISHFIKHIVPPPSARIFFALDYIGQELLDGVTRTHITDCIREACTQVLRWRAGSVQSGAKEQTKDIGALQRRPSPYSSVAVDSLDDFSYTAHISVSSRLLFPPRLEWSNWCEGVEGVHAELTICTPCSTRGVHPVQQPEFLPVIMSEVVRALAAEKIRALSVNELGMVSAPHFLDALADPVFRNIEILRFPLIEPGTMHALAASNRGVDGGARTFRLFPALRVLEMLPGPLRILTKLDWALDLDELAVARRSAGSGLLFYLHLVDQVDILRKSIPENMSPGEVTFRRGVDDVMVLMSAIEGVSLIGTSAVVPYAALVQDEA